MEIVVLLESEEHVLTPPKLGDLRDVARDIIFPYRAGLKHMNLMGVSNKFVHDIVA